MDATGAIKHRMSGAYSSEIYADTECIWKRKRGISEFYYGYTHLSMQLNYLNADIIRVYYICNCRIYHALIPG